MVALAIGAVGASYAAVPLYKVFCQTTGFGFTTRCNKRFIHVGI